MHTHQVRFTSQWALVGVILFYSVGTAMIARHMHMERIFTPTSAGSSECAIIPEMPNLPEPLVGEYRQDSATGLSGTGFQPVKNGQDGRSTEDGFSLNASSGAVSTELCGDAFGPVRWPDGTEWFSNGSNTTETPWHGLPAREKTAKMAVPQTSDTVRMRHPAPHRRTNTPAKQVLTQVRTKIRCVEAILKNAVIEPYHINGQIEGLRITGLDRILVARNLLLKSGDIIRAVNGQTLNSKRRAYEIFKRARKLPIMKIELLRDGKTKTLLYYLR